MKSIFKGLIYFIFFIVMLIMFLPKENIYFFLLEKLKENKIELVQQNINNGIFKFGVDDIKLNYDSIQVSSVSKIDIDMLIYNTKIAINNIKVDDSFKKFVPNKIQYLTVNHSILDPLFITIDAKFNLGSCVGKINLLNNTLYLDITVAKKFKRKYRNIVKQLKYEKEKSTNKMEVYSFEYKY